MYTNLQTAMEECCPAHVNQGGNLQTCKGCKQPGSGNYNAGYTLDCQGNDVGNAVGNTSCCTAVPPPPQYDCVDIESANCCVWEIPGQQMQQSHTCVTIGGALPDMSTNNKWRTGNGTPISFTVGPNPGDVFVNQAGYINWEVLSVSAVYQDLNPPTDLDPGNCGCPQPGSGTPTTPDMSMRMAAPVGPLAPDDNFSKLGDPNMGSEEDEDIPTDEIDPTRRLNENLKIASLQLGYLKLKEQSSMNPGGKDENKLEDTIEKEIKKKFNEYGSVREEDPGVYRIKFSYMRREFEDEVWDEIQKYIEDKGFKIDDEKSRNYYEANYDREEPAESVPTLYFIDSDQVDFEKGFFTENK